MLHYMDQLSGAKRPDLDPNYQSGGMKNAVYRQQGRQDLVYLGKLMYPRNGVESSLLSEAAWCHSQAQSRGTAQRKGPGRGKEPWSQRK